jgi:hypothetical protein
VTKPRTEKGNVRWVSQGFTGVLMTLSMILYVELAVVFPSVSSMNQVLRGLALFIILFVFYVDVRAIRDSLRSIEELARNNRDSPQVGEIPDDEPR